MNASKVVLLEEASDDLEFGRRFYEEKESGIEGILRTQHSPI